jgi:hypothetical protein
MQRFHSVNRVSSSGSGVWEQYHILSVKLCGTLHVDLVLRVWAEAESYSRSNTVLIKYTTTVRSFLSYVMGLNLT